ncbi:hypothetical protein IJ818_01775 [bacterium]|nr:hypothetical protein [bacterium]
MFISSAIALLIQADLNLLAYDDNTTGLIASKIELTIPEISKKDLKNFQKGEKYFNPPEPRASKSGIINLSASKNSASTKNLNIKKTKLSSKKTKPKFHKPVFRKSPEIKELEYVYKVQKRELKERYEKNLMPKSGYMTKAEYEAESKVKDKSREDMDFKPPIQDKDMKYLPQPTYKLVRYNNPPGSPEIRLTRKYKFERSEKDYGLVSNDLKMMVYPVVYYYADRNVTSGEIYVVPLDTTLPDTQRILKANIARRSQKPILETEKDTEVRNTFRTMTPIDFDVDCTKLIAKEKIGNTFDGIWQTNVWVYDFKTKKAVNLTEIRQAILHFWEKEKGFELSEYRWDIYPLGFDKRNKDRVIINAYAFTGKKPQFLGAWSIDYNGAVSKLESLSNQSMDVSVIGFKLIQSGIKDPEVVKAETKHLKDVSKIEKKQKKKAAKLEKKKKKEIYKKQLKELKEEFYQKRDKLLEDPKKKKRKGVPTS